jgi:hypothetical protein
MENIIRNTQTRISKILRMLSDLIVDFIPDICSQVPVLGKIFIQVKISSLTFRKNWDKKRNQNQIYQR